MLNKIIEGIGEQIKETAEISREEYLKTKKEVKKVKKEVDYKKIKYWDVKVVEAKKEEIKECRHNKLILSLEKNVYCYACKKILKENVTWEEFMKNNFCMSLKRKGNWVNGENIDKIKFPVPCSYIKDSKEYLGLLSMNNGYYYIADITEQKKIQEDVIKTCYDLKEFITKHNIHILKGKIVVFKEKEVN